MGAPLLRSTLFVAAPGNHDIADPRPGEVPRRPGLFPLLGPAAQRSARPGGRPARPAAHRARGNRAAFLRAAGAAYPRMANFSFDYGNAHWTVLDSNPYVDWTDPDLRGVGRARPGRRPGRHLAVRRLPPPCLQFVQGPLRRPADAAAGRGLRGGPRRRRLERACPQLSAHVSRSPSAPETAAPTASRSATRTRSPADGRSTRSFDGRDQHPAPRRDLRRHRRRRRPLFTTPSSRTTPPPGSVTLTSSSPGSTR